MNVEDRTLKTKNYFRKEIIEKFPIQLNEYAFH
jgi:predicted DNA-binding protein